MSGRRPPRRPTVAQREIRAGCFVCHAPGKGWTTSNAQALAARHHDVTGHQTWCNVYLTYRYGAAEADPRQTDIEDAIAASSGERPVSLSLTDPDAPATAIAGVSAPQAALSRQGARGPKPETSDA